MKILNLGSCNVDYVYRVEHIIKPGETLGAQSLSVFPGGKGLNQSIALAKAGAKVMHAGLIGKEGKFLKDTLKNAGVDVRFLKIGKAEGGHAIIQVDDKGENCICVFEGTNGQIDEEFIDGVFAHFSKGDLLLLQNEVSSLKYAVEKAYEKGMKTVLNPSPFNSKITELDLNKIEYLILNETEAAAISGKSCVIDAIEYIKSTYPKLKTVLTLGKNGSVYFSADECTEMQAFDAKVVDTTSAGDCFTGYFFASLSSGMSVKDAMTRASLASSVTVSRKGASVSIPTAKEIDELLLNLT